MGICTACGKRNDKSKNAPAQRAMAKYGIAVLATEVYLFGVHRVCLQLRHL